MATKTASAAPIEPIPFTEALSQRYLAYALSTITARSLPDVRDGLKPVQRRILYAMLKLRLDPEGGYKKCARVVGDVIGKFHPHGEGAIYDAMVRLAQEFAQRYPLVDGQGNFGNVDGDNAAAMRYTEARLTEVARALLDGIDQDTVDFRATYDGGDEEPVVLPAAFPNLLANGTSGIAVGMATSIPPHNAGELCQALCRLLERPDTPVEDLLELVKGPDLPTGGVLVEPWANVVEAYRSGRGSLRLRARWQREDLGHGQYQIVVTEMPYQVPKSRLVERIAELLAAKKLSLLADVRDESAEEVRLVLVPRARTVPDEVLMEQLFRQTDLEVRLPLNLNVLDAEGVPRVMSLDQLLRAFLEHRMVVLIRRSRHRLGKIEERLEVLDAYRIAYLNLDEVIRIIREEDEPKAELMRAFELTERQAEAILNMRLRNLRRLEEQTLLKEQKALRAERRELKELLKDEGLRRAKLREEIEEIGRRFGDGPLGRRRTTLGEAPVIDGEALEAPVERQPVTIVCSRQGWIRVIRGHVEDGADLKYKEGDGPRFLLHGQSTDRLLLISSDGRGYLLPVERLPGGRGQGEPLRLHVDLGRGAEPVMLVIHREGGRILLASSAGRGFVAETQAIAAQTRAGRQVFNLDEGERIVVACPAEGDHVATIGTNRKMLIFPLDQLPVMSRGKGVLLQRYKDGRLADACVFARADGLSWPSTRGLRVVTELEPWLGKRGQAGRLAPSGFPRSNRFAG
ncbi:MAG TPA: DNA topoisomerase IV subunit A [Geminicoccaceae bacterium]|nr:DNA topoisomerase IV subunit A [Geminicoccaceae bacterium]